DPGPGRGARRADRGRLPERRRAAGGAPSQPARRTLPGRVRVWLIGACPGARHEDTLRTAVLRRTGLDEISVELAGAIWIFAEQRQHPTGGEECRLRRLADHRDVAAPPPLARCPR